MNLLKISLQNMRVKPLYTFLSVLLLALSIGLLLGIQQIKSSFEYQLENNLGGIDLVVGAKGSPLQLVLSSVLHIDNPTGNIPYKESKKISKNPMIRSAVPISYGDNYKGYRIVGTTEQFFSLYKAELLQGDFAKKSMEVVLGHSIAEKLELKIGDAIQSAHGLIENDVDVHDDQLKVVGILKPTQKVIDRLIITQLETIWDVHDHEHHEEEDHNDEDEKHEHDDEDEDHEHEDEHEHDEEHEDEDDKEITSLLLSFRNPTAILTFPRNINENTNMMAAIPKYELNRLYEFTSVGISTITWIAYLILIISGMTIFISLYKMVKDRAFDLALLRTYGASNFQLIRMVIYEGIAIVGLAFLLGFLLIKAGIYFIFEFLESSYQQNMIQDVSFDHVLKTLGLVFIIVVVSALLSILPIIKMNISSILSNEK